MSKGRELGLVDDTCWKDHLQKKKESERETERLKGTTLIPNSKEARGLETKTKEKIRTQKSLYEILKRPKICYLDLPGARTLPKNTIDEIEAGVKYLGYVARQEEEIRKQKKNEKTPIPDNLNFENVVGLSNEVRQKLTESKPNNIARAARLPGITPAAISLLLVHLNRG
jgi:tRNA uridine 5-carboxymethylaminomethyl modification enzyme